MILILSILTLTIRNKVFNREISLVLRLMNGRIRVTKLALDIIIVVVLAWLVQAEGMMRLGFVQV